ncbi:MAG: GTP cyclohydrolase II [Acidobacteria bacterium]|nr:GTP cyclohydrolase II [Acidobacteriota bacterium]
MGFPFASFSTTKLSSQNLLSPANVPNDAASTNNRTAGKARAALFIIKGLCRYFNRCRQVPAKPAPAPQYNRAVDASRHTQDAVIRIAEADFPTRWGRFRIFGFQSSEADEEAVALVMGDVHTSPPLVRIHSQCLTGDVFGSLRCDCRQQLEMALAAIAAAGAGILIYEQQEGRGIGLMPKLQAYELQDQGLDTVEANERLGFKADLRDYAMPAAILNSFGVHAVRLLSNNPEKVQALEHAGIRVTERVPCEVEPHAGVEHYLRTKQDKLGHIFGSQKASGGGK